MKDYSNFFREATGNCPYPYQARLASMPIASRALQVPTGAGKTAASILAWLYRLEQGFHDAPERMAYCLPMRVLVEQTRKEAVQWIARVGSCVKVSDLDGWRGG